MKTKHAPIKSGQNVFSALAYSDSDVLDLGAKINTEKFVANPVLLQEHDGNRPIGQIVEFKWKKEGLYVEFFFDTDSEQGREAERKWERGLASSLSVGVEALWNDDKSEITGWALREVSQVSIPLDPDATAKPDERQPKRMAGIRELLKIDPSTLHKSKDFVILTASMASKDQRNPLRTAKSDSNMPDEKKPDYRDEYVDVLKEKIATLTQTVTELTEKVEASQTEMASLKETHSKEIETLNASLKEAQEAAEAVNQDELQQLANEVNEKEAKLDAEVKEFEMKQARAEVENEAARWRQFLPASFDTDGLEVRDVLIAACPKHLRNASMSDDTIRGILIHESNNRLRASLSVKRGSGTVTSTDDSGSFYIAPHQLKNL